MKKLWFTIFCCLLFSELIMAQTNADYLKRIDSLEVKIQLVKALPKDEQKQYFAVLSDVENRKNTLISLLKTPEPKRDKAWLDSWEKNYSKASEKLNKIKLK